MKVIQRYVISWLSLSLLFATISYSANTKNKTQIREEKPTQIENSSPDRFPAVTEKLQVFQPTVSAETSPNNFDTAGISYYDLNGIDRNSRQIAFVPGIRNTAIAWAKSPDATLVSRNVFGTLWVEDSKCGGCVLPEIPMSATLTGRGGFCGVTYFPRTSRLVLYASHAETPKGTFVAYENTAGGFDWDDEFPVPDSVPGDSFPGSWPSAAGGFMIDTEDYDGDGSTSDSVETIHFFMMEGNTAGSSIDHYIYARGIDSAGTLLFPGFTGNIGMAVDSGTQVSPVVVTSKQSPKVALIWTSERQCNFNPSTCSDIYCLESTNGGQDWVDAGGFSSFSPVNITNYGPTDTVRATGDLMGVFDMNDSLVISFVEYVDYDPVTGTHSQEANIFVWTREWGKRKAVDGNFDQMPPQAEIPGGNRRLTLNWPHIGVHNGDGQWSRLNLYYLVYVQYGGNAQSEWSDTADNGFLNGEVYVTVSNDHGKTWSYPYNITYSKTPGCALGACSGVSFASCAEVVDDTIHIAYMSDLYAGSLVEGDQGTSAASNNPVIYMKFPAYGGPPDPPYGRIAVYPEVFPYQNPGSALIDTFLVRNIGNIPAKVDSIRHINSNSWFTLNMGVDSFTIPEGGPDVLVPFTVDDIGLADGFYVDTVRVYNNSLYQPIVKLTVRMVVDNSAPFHTPAWKDLDNSIIKLRISNVGNIGHRNSEAGFYRIIGSDTTNNLYDGTTFMAVILSNGDTVVGRWIFYSQKMWPLDTLSVFDTTLTSTLQKPGSKVKIPAGDYQVARTAYASFFPFALGVEYPGPWFGFRINEEWWLPKLPDPVWNPAFVLNCQTIETMPTGPSWWPSTQAFDPNATTVYFGKALDWDVFSNASVNTSADNFGRPVPATGATWVEGVDPSFYFEVDSALVPNGHFALLAFLDSLDNLDPYAMHVASNEYAIYPYEGNDAQLYIIASDATADTVDPYPGTPGKQFKYFSTDPWEHDSLPTDLNVVMTNIQLAPPYPASFTISNALGVIDDTSSWSQNPGCYGMAVAYNDIRIALGLDPIPNLASALECSTEGHGASPGDASADGVYSLVDIVRTLNYIFNKPGCTPTPLCWLSNLLCRGDWNGSGTVTLADVIQGVNYLFGKPGGPWYPVSSPPCYYFYSPP